MDSHEKHKIYHANGVKAQKAGAAIVELVLAMLLMMSMIVFSVFICRALSQRNRALAASRTAAWLYTHADKPQGVDSVETPNFQKTLSAWHFGATDPTRVSLSMSSGKGLMAPGDARGILNAVEAQKEQKQSDEGVGELDGSTDWGVSPSAFVDDCVRIFGNNAVNWLTQDFEHCQAEVQVSTPLIFGPEAYQLFGWLENGFPPGAVRRALQAVGTPSGRGTGGAPRGFAASKGRITRNGRSLM